MFRICLLVAFLLSTGLSRLQAEACVLDQSLTTWNGGTSERNLPGYSEWQSFTAALSGQLCEIDLMFGNSNIKLNGTGTLKFFTGTGTSGTLLFTQAVSVNGTSYNINTNFWQNWIITTPPSVVQGSVYTFQFIPDRFGGLPDPYIIVVNTNNAYPGGRNSQAANFDNPFKTWVRSALPLSLLSLKAEPLEKSVHVSWTTAQEVNTKEFTVERSLDGKYFSLLGLVKAFNVPGTHHYDFYDGLPATGVAYYRLKMADREGSAHYSPVVKVLINEGVMLLVYPNPCRDFLYLRGHRLQEARIIDAEGRLLKSQKLLDGINAINVSSIPTQSFTLLVITSRGEIIKEKVVRTN